MSVTGVVYLAMMLFMGAAAVNSQANLLFGVLGLMMGIGVVTYSINRLVLRKLAVTRVLPEHGVVGQHCVYTYEVTNNKRFWPSFSVTVAELDGADAFLRQPQGYLLHCAATMTAQVPCEVIPRRRGLHQLERYQIATSFPFGFVKRADTRKQRDSILIYPALADVNPRVLSLARSAENTGAHASAPRRQRRVLRREGAPTGREPAVHLLAAQRAHGHARRQGDDPRLAAQADHPARHVRAG
jgi:uncharacterized protein (DUF58 family)